jgi:hypothetical protein
MSSKIALRLAALALGAVFASAPALAQDYYGQAPGYGQYAPGNEAPGYGPYNAPGYGLYNEAPGMVSSNNQRAASDCAARFHSYDPASGTYLGFDGRRHPCP